MADKSLSLKPYESKEGLELLIDQNSGAVFASQSALARMCAKSASTIARWRSVADVDTFQAEIQTAAGIRSVALYDESAIEDAVLKYNPLLAKQMLRAGLRVYLYGMAGYEVAPRAPEQAVEGVTIGVIGEAYGLLSKVFGPAYAESAVILNMRRHHPQLALPEVPAAERSSLKSADALLTPTQLAAELGVHYTSGKPNPRAANKLLEEMGLQEKIAGQWQPTETGKPYCDRKPIDTGSRSDKTQLLWFSSVLELLREDVAA